MDALEWTKVLMALVVCPNLDAQSSETACLLGESPCITDCKALFDAAQNEHGSAGKGLAEKRTAIELLMIQEKIKQVNGKWRWVDTTQQMADGLTKVSVRQIFADRLRRCVHALKYDPSFTAGKKVTANERARRERELDTAEDHALQCDDSSQPNWMRIASVVTKLYAASKLPVVKGESTCQAVAVQSSEVELWHHTVDKQWLLTIVFIIGVAFGMLCVLFCWELRDRFKVQTVVVRNVMTQSQCMYDTGHTQSRFRLVPEYAQGAWPDSDRPQPDRDGQ